MRIPSTVIIGIVSLLSAASLAAQVSLTVESTMDIYRAGGYNDGSNGIAPVVYSFPARALSTLTFPSVGGGWTCQSGYPDYGADGETSGYCVVSGGATNFSAIGPLSGYHLTDFVGPLAGVFLEDALPASAPAALRFYVSDNSAGGIQTSFLTLSPQIGQVFFIGDGLTGTGTGHIQTFQVPSTATHLYLGYVDNCRAPGNTVPGCYSDNVGTLNVVVQIQNHVPDWVEPSLSSAPSARFAPGVAYDAANHATVLFGGGNARLPNGVVYGDTWMWRNGWTLLSPAAAPAARSNPAMAYDPSTGTVLLFGGQDANAVVMGDTWTWDGVTWTQQFPPASPAARSSAQGMIYDPVTETVVLFGGAGNGNDDYGAPVFGDTWEWNGRTKTWTQDFPASSPPARSTPLAFDTITKTVVLFGGDNGGGDCCRVFFGDTWTWNGVTWKQRTPATHPSARTGPSLAYDPVLGQVVLFGGTSGPPEGLNDTWAWDGGTWRQLKPTQPTGVWGASMAFDPLNAGLLLFGGELSGDVVTNNTWLFVPVPAP